MQNRYVGDIGDFGKYGLLRWLCGKREVEISHPHSSAGKLKLGVVWYFNEDYGGGGDQISYLSSGELQDCDYELHRKLNKIVHGKRTVECVENSRILPERTKFFRCPIDYSSKEARQAWLDKAITSIEKTDIVFADPDNGLAIEDKETDLFDNGIPAKKSTPFSREGKQHLFLSDLTFLSRGRCSDIPRSLIIYHHLARFPHVEQIRFWSRQLQLSLNPVQIWALRHQHKSFLRLYFVLAMTPQHHVKLQERLLTFYNGPWARHFLPVDCSLLIR